MSSSRYEKYKKSGVEWLGEVPAHWGIGQSRRLFAQRKERALETDSQLTASQKHGVIYQRDFMELEGQKVVQVIHGADILKHVEPNDFVISMRSFQGGIEWCGLRGCISSAYVMLVPCDRIEAGFFRYLLKSSTYIQALQSTSNLVRDGQALRYENFTLVDLPLVPAHEQQAIAAFLDRETAKIDALVDEQKRLIKLLKEKRQAVISHAVTKGLNPDAPIKESGVAWLGEVPSHWDVKPLKHCMSFQEGPGIMATDFREIGTPLLRISCVQGSTVSLNGCNFLDPEKVALQWAHFRVEIGDLVISGSASMGVVSEVGDEAVGSIPYTGLIRLQGRPDGMLKRFIKFLVISDAFMRQVQLLKTGSTIQHFGPTHLNQMVLVCPPAGEQAAIANYLEKVIARIDALTLEAEAGMELLQERRTALISAAVTGKIDVRSRVDQEVLEAA